MQTRLDKVRNHPLHKYLGVSKIDAKDGSAELFAIVNEAALNPSGNYHGGVVYMLCDVCAYCAVLSALPEGQDAVTHDIHISVLRPALENDSLEYRASIKKLGRSLCFIDVEVKSGEHLVATARVTKSLIGS
ncbi:MAG: PaaI family thioesterase [Pseudohongiellaceae bacterium]|nr:PaaI family thioesterase [Pseudohongiellaceae bacterium]